jgi:sugar lactone lactonase YvrE
MRSFLCLLFVSMAVATADAGLPTKWLPATAHVIPKFTASEGEGYFSIIEGHNGRLYVGTHANAVNSWLVEFDPAANRMAVVVDAHKAIGTDLKGFGSQAKIHTRNNTGKLTGRIYFGTKQGYPSKDEKREDYPGGYPMVYDPKTGKTKVYPIPVPYHGINSITPDESRGVAYISTCSDHRPGPGENAVFLKLDLETGKYRELIDTEHYYGFIVVDWLGRAYHPLLGGDIARYDPKTDKLERLQQTIDGKPPTDACRLALTPPDPINWDISPDGKTLYALPMSGNELFAYDLTAEGNVLAGRTLGELIPGATKTDCRSMCVGPSGAAWCAITENVNGVRMLHLVRHRPGDSAPVDLGVIEVTNPDFTEFTDKAGKPLPYHAGFTKLENGKTVTRYVILGVCETRDGNVHILAMHPYSVLQVRAADLKE